jgi:hypothetical protein
MIRTDRTSGNAVNFIMENIIAAMNKTKPPESNRPKLILGTKGLSPREAAALVQAWPNTVLLHDLQGGQWFLPRVDPTLLDYKNAYRTADSTAPAPKHVVIGGPQGASQYLYWGDPQWMRDLCMDLRHHGLDGMFLLTRSAEPWLARESFAYYAQGSRDAFVPRYWQEQLHLHYGCGRQAEHLLAAVRHASAIMPALVTFMHDRSADYMPQFGLPLAHVLAMPTVSTYPESYNYMETKKQADRDWGLDLQPLGYATDPTSMLDTSDARRLAADLFEQAELAESRLTNLKTIEAPGPEQRDALSKLIPLLELNIACGKHYAHRLEAAVAWKEFKAARGRANTFMQVLLDSVKDWRQVVDVAEKIYPDPLPYRQSQMVSVPPWSIQQLHDSYRPVVGHWRDHSALLDREFRIMQMKIDATDLQTNLPMWDRLAALPHDALTKMLRFNFESTEDPRIELHEKAEIVGKPNALFKGRMVLLGDSSDWGDGRHTLFHTVPAHAPIPAHLPLQISIAYAVLDSPEPGPYQFEIGLFRRGDDRPIGDHRCWTAPADYLGRRVLQIEPLAHEDYMFYMKIKGAARIVVDDLQVSIIK